MREMKSLTLNDKTYDAFVDPVARSLASAAAVINSASGESITVSDASGNKLYGFRIYGKTTQNGTPTPDAPVEMVSVGDSGSITVNVTGEDEKQSMTVATPNGLPGIPVASGGNYADSKGQQWICDEIDFARGVYVQRVYRKKFTNADGIKRVESGFGYRFAYSTPQLVRSDKTNGVCSLCDSLPLAGYGGTFSTPSCYTVNDIEIMIALTGSETIAELADYLAEKPIEVRAVLVEPIETPLSEEELAAYASLYTYRDNTTVSNDAGAYMELEYVMDAKKYIDSLVAGNIPQATGTILPATVE